MPKSSRIARSETSPTIPIPVFYTEAQVAAAQSFSPSAGKPREVMRRWRESGHPMTVLEPHPVIVDEIARAHDRAFVEGVLACRIPNGFGNCSRSVAQSLPWTNGAMLSAARHAIRTGGVACAPCSGFHHAHWDRPGGYCTFNGLMVTAMALREEGLAKRVGILDGDQHYGDGTADIITRTKSSRWIRHITAGHGYRREARSFLQLLPKIVRSFAKCDVLLYQAGADPHVDDPLGGFLDDEQLARRDAIVFTTAREIGLPVAWNLAGGYQDPLANVLDIHDRTMAACVNSAAWAPP